MNISLLTGLMVTGMVVLGAMLIRVLIALRNQASAVKIPVRVRTYREWKE